MGHVDAPSTQVSYAVLVTGWYADSGPDMIVGPFSTREGANEWIEANVKRAQARVHQVDTPNKIRSIDSQYKWWEC